MEPNIVSTFHCLSLYWSPPTGDESVKCHVNYRRVGSAEWHAAQDLWYDARTLHGRPAQYRGSIVNLQPDSEYEIQLWLEDAQRTELFTRARTWSEQFPIAETIHVPPHSETTFRIETSGSADGYVLYMPVEGQQGVIDVENKEDFCVFLPESTHHVILRGLTLRGAARHGIRMNDYCHDIVIEECDISNWGNADSSGFGINLQAAISAPYRADHIERLVIQNNKIHHPRSDANSWGEPRANPGGDPFHPQGPYGLVFFDTKGNHVIRYNDFYTDDEHYFCDILGAGSNISFAGFPDKDSDIYGNCFERCWDDAIESEGANENVRIWGNTIDRAYHPIGAVVTSVGPLYVWRNIIKRNRKFGHIEDPDLYDRGEFIKCGGTYDDGVFYGQGRMYVYHNTILQPNSPNGSLPLGCEGALVAEGRFLYNAVTRNNIFTNYDTDKYTFRDNPEDYSQCGRNDFDWDLYTGQIKETCETENYQEHGIHLLSNDEIIYNPDDPAGPYALMPDTPGHDAGVLLPNFNDYFNGQAPDMGAVESKIDSPNTAPGQGGRALTFKLYQNYPNPFNASTRILYYIPRQVHVNLEIYNVRGERVAVLVDEQQPAGGYATRWFAAEFASGLYFAQMTAGNFRSIQKMILVR